MIASRLVTGLVTLLAVTLVAGCSGDSSDQHPDKPLPRAGKLLDAAAESIADINSTHVSLRTNGKVPGLRISSLDGDLRRTGDRVEAKGSGKMQAMGRLVKLEFVLSGGNLYLKGLTGNDYRKLPASVASSIYDPSVLLDPDAGIAKVLRSVRGAKTVGREQAQGTSTFKVTGSVPGNVISGLLPGASGKAEVTFWLAADDGHRPVKAKVGFPGSQGDGDDPGSVVVTLSAVNEPVTIEPPA